MGIVEWREKMKDRREWRKTLNEVKKHNFIDKKQKWIWNDSHCPQNKWIRRVRLGFPNSLSNNTYNLHNIIYNT